MIGFLLSYWYFRDRDIADLLDQAGLLRDGKATVPLLADSGAYSAHTSGTPVDLGAYAEWLHQWRHLFDAYANLDVMADAAATAANQQALEDRGLAPLPVFHAGEPWEALRDLAGGYDYLALGGLVSAPFASGSPAMRGWCHHAFDLAGDIRLHGFGMTNWRLVQELPWHSVDSSSCGASFRYGSVVAWNPYRRRWTRWNLHDARAWGRHGWLVREYALDPADFAGDDTGRQRVALIRLAVRSWQRAAQGLAADRVYLVDAAFGQAERGIGGGPRLTVWADEAPHVYLSHTKDPNGLTQMGHALDA